MRSRCLEGSQDRGQAVESVRVEETVTTESNSKLAGPPGLLVQFKLLNKTSLFK